MGDFSEMLHMLEKVGGTPRSPNKVQRLNDVLQFSNSYDANVQGQLFTWKNLLRGNLVCEKLDRVIQTSTTLIAMDRVVALFWSIWKTRNNKVFRDELPPPMITLIRAKKVSAEWRIRHKFTTHSIHHSTNIQPPGVRRHAGSLRGSCRKGTLKLFLMDPNHLLMQ